ncbi:MAG: alanine racemase [Chloroflexi bacterium]|nr:alanine racemase [Chloroflexota bacterium]
MIADLPLSDEGTARIAAGRAPWPCWIEVDLDAVAENVRVLARAARPRLGVTAVVKAQAYGLGATAVARAAMEAGARGVAVARVAEGIQMRQTGLDAPILVMGGIHPAEAPLVVRHGLQATVADEIGLTALARAAEMQGSVSDVQVKVDSGMNRYGAAPADAADLVRRLATIPSLRLAGFYTHFASADERDLWFSRQQVAYYRSVVAQLETEGYELGVKHVANSAGALRMDDVGFDTVRAGLALSGSYATEHVPHNSGLWRAVALKSRVARLLTPPVGASIGYGRTFKVDRPMRTALVSCGYADGLPRACSNRGQVLIRGRRAPLVGTVSMDMAMADVTHLPEVQVGDEVVVLGQQGDATIDLDTFSESAGIIPHELLVRLGARVPRVYFRGSSPVSATSLLQDVPLDLG